MNRRFTGAVAAGVVAAGTLLGGGIAAASAKRLQTIKVGTGPVADFAQLFVAQKEGYLAKNGLKVDTAPILSGPEGVAAIKSGSIDFTYSATLPLFLANQSGANLRYVGPGDTESPGHWQFYLEVKKGSSIRTLKQALSGGTKIGWIGSSTPNAIAIQLYMRKYGIKSSGASFVTLAPPDITTALSNGEVQAAIPLEPFTTIGLQTGLKQVGGPLDTIMGNDVPTGGYFTSESWAKSNTQTIKEFDKALAQATHYISTHPKQTNQIIGAALKLKPAVVNALPPIQFVSQLPTAALQKEISEANSVGLLSAKLKAASLITS
ncbi:MAG TPA: ABC transporter substrate-binding protein [Solirubrobacteraceae bacterium]|jgi:ABC-type nitrate/sulfonate/bicarbonate transport system substrate-binding protein|nr:ABC transporter substrate-binding protein [Solirubrobacteraceae bacterium]